MSWLESQIQRQPEAAARRKRREVNEARNKIAAVVYLWIEAVVAGEDEQVAGGETDLTALRSAEAGRHPCRQVVREVDLADLGERSVDEVGRGVGTTTP